MEEAQSKLVCSISTDPAQVGLILENLLPQLQIIDPLAANNVRKRLDLINRFSTDNGLNDRIRNILQSTSLDEQFDMVNTFELSFQQAILFLRELEDVLLQEQVVDGIIVCYA